jgi:hypothetical protein
MARSNLAFLGLLSIALGGCSGKMERMSTWMGVEHKTLIEELGKPDRSYQGQIGLVKSWYRNQQEKVGCTDDFTVKDGVVIGFASNCGIFGGWTAPVYEP